MDKLMGIVLTLGAGLFFLIGGLISLKVKNKSFEAVMFYREYSSHLATCLFGAR